MARYLYLLYGILAYLVFFAIFLYLIAFLADVPWIPLSVDRGPSAATGLALLVDLSLIGLFGVQHSLMARPSFKSVWVRLIPAPVERSTYVLFTCAALIVSFAGWRPITIEIWRIDGAVLRAVVWGVFALGWGVVLLSTFLISHSELFGLKQIVQHWQRRKPAPPRLQEPFLYKLVRHPQYAGFLLAFWAAPTMSAGHLVFALSMSAYVLVAIRFEERNLIDTFGTGYVAYRGKTGMLVPKVFRSSRPDVI